MAEVFSAEVTVSIAKYAAEIAKIEAETSKSATRASVALVKQLTAGQKQAGDAANAAARRAGEAWEDAAQQTTMAGTAANGAKVSYGNLANQIADVTKGLASGQSPLTIATQQGEQLYFALAQAGGAMAVLKAGLTALAPFVPHLVAIGAAVAALGYAWHQANKELDAANLKMEESAKIAADAQKAYEDLAEVRSSTTDKWLVATGQATSADLELRDTIAKVTEVYGPRIKAKEDDIRATEAGIEAALKASQTAGRTAEETKKANDEYWAGKAALEQHKAALAGLTDQQGVYLQRAAVGILTTEDDTKGRKKNAKAIEEQADQMSFFSMALIQYEEQQRVTAEIEARRAYVTAEAISFVGKAWDEARTKAAKAGAIMRDESIAAQKELEARGEAERQQIVATLAAQQDATASLIGSTADAFALASESIKGLSKEQALQLFYITKAAQVAQALILAPSAILQGLAQAGPIGGVAAGVAAGVQVASIIAAKPPSFRRGGVIGDMPDVQTVNAETGEGIVNRQGMAALGPTGLQALNAGMGAGSGAQSPRIMLNGRDIGRIIETGVQSARGRRAVTEAPARGRAPRKGT